MAERDEQSPKNDGTVDSFDEALSILGDETRLEILLALAKEANEQGVGSGLTFSDLREQVGVEDSGRFNYHLNELRDQFVTKLDEEYVARYPGLAIVATMYAGVHRDTVADESRTAETEFTCPECDREVQLHYGARQLYSGMWMECPEHGSFDKRPVPPGAQMDRSLHELMTVAATRFVTNLALARQGICLQCWGNVTVEYPTDVPEEYQIADRIPVKIQCDRCWNHVSVVLRSLFLEHPSVRGPFADRGYSLLETMEMVTAVDELSVCETELLGTDPASARLCIDLDDESIELTIDEECTVIDVEHSR
jgi:DNA-binding transcriptional ArsR family regulator